MPIAPNAPIPPSRPMNTGSVVIFVRLEMNSGRMTLSADETTATLQITMNSAAPQCPVRPR